MSKKIEVEVLSVFDRRAALAKLGLGLAAAYVAPMVLKLSEARAGSGGSGEGGEGGSGGASGGDSSGGASGGDSSGGGSAAEASEGGSSGDTVATSELTSTDSIGQTAPD
ncbi:MAG TPA: hypothetical protein VMY41_09855 [Thermohalobaculum sp.]|nr:hypothetical protein [Thermohalobaculum sp.]